MGTRSTELRYQETVKLIAEKVLKVDPTCVSRSVARVEGQLQKDSNSKGETTDFTFGDHPISSRRTTCVGGVK